MSHYFRLCDSYSHFDWSSLGGVGCSVPGLIVWDSVLGFRAQSLTFSRTHVGRTMGPEP